MANIVDRRVVPQVWVELMSKGWVNVTGLRQGCRSAFSAERTIFPYPDMKFRTGSNNGKSVFYNNDGTVWLRVGRGSLPSSIGPLEYGNAYVPCSNGEIIDMGCILARIADPFWNDDLVVVYNQDGTETKMSYVRYPAFIDDLQLHPEWYKHIAFTLSRT